MPATIYLSAALFTVAERRFNRRLADALEAAGHEVILPQELDHLNDQEAVFRLNLEALDRADLILAVVEGTDVDSGVAWEMGYAHRAGTPVAALRTDFRDRSETEGAAVNLMLHRGAIEYVVAGDDWAEAAVAMVERVVGKVGG